ncbi:unnamed protein product [Didymodactylos carnosus]|uniref:Uncharacterized protein n=1 Tax=Didymodactylos carnosus TaxID=1234261 RepID=A0A815RXQ8_9BILA|nr:unnamed protein product [Didymodactylos carnosus]CAF1484358.1 unnamed protein product [Didymodactylos carnosus]CAF4134407.1 unnamed protein product [Didymodactylos carnosus]CAF4348709.1 unnamed protein product [Didymodactylos carnosus]
MAFLYSSYITIYAIANPLLGKYIDGVYNSSGTVRPTLLNTAAIQLTIILAVVFASAFIPKGAIAFNPVLLDEEDSADPVDSVEHPDVMFDKSLDSRKAEQGVQKEKSFPLITYF